MSTVPSTKRNLIDKTNARIVVYISIATFILIFSLVGIKVLVSQAMYQNRIIAHKRAAVNQLRADITASTQLKSAYAAFTGTAQNAIGGDSNGTGAKDGNNAKIILDALPSSYDFPGLTTNLENLVAGQGVTINSITGTDDEIAQSGNQSSATPQPVAMPFSLSVQGSYSGLQNVVNALGQSIRPMQIQILNITGTKDALSMDVTAQTYYQPAKSLNITKKAIK